MKRADFLITICGFLNLNALYAKDRLQNTSKYKRINIKEFGAEGDGTNDDTPFIQKAIDTISVSGGQVYIPKGTYLVTKQLNLRSNVKIYGDGHTSIILQNYITNGELQAVIAGDNTNNVSIENLKIVGSGMLNKQSTMGIYLTGSNNCKISKCTITNNYLGIVVFGLDSKSASNNITISENKLYSIGLNAISSNNIGHNITIINNNIHDYGQVGTPDNISGAIEFRGGSNSIIKNNTMNSRVSKELGTIDGIRIEYATEPKCQVKSVSVSNNHIKNVSGYGIRVQYCNECRIENNYISDSLAGGIVLLGNDFQGKSSNHNIVLNNTIQYIPHHFGIKIEGDLNTPCTNNAILKNNIFNCRDGITVYYGDTNTIEIGHIKNADASAIYHYTGYNNIISYGKINSSFNGVVIMGGANLHIENISFKDITNYDIYIAQNAKHVNTKKLKNLKTSINLNENTHSH